ncbi:MAG: phosphoribosylanthranilate isomerase [Phycisphaerales bacterium]
MGRTRIKICGITTREAMHTAAEAGADAVGFVFVEKSPRNIHPREAWRLACELPPMVTTVGLYVNPSLDEFAEIEQQCPTMLTQLHGYEQDRLVKELGPELIKAVKFDPETIAGRLKHYDEIDEVSAILVDGSDGGEGVAFDWSLLAEATKDIATPIILAGGLDPSNVGEAIEKVRPFAVDVSSGVESERGVKDLGKIRAFCQAVQAADSKLL